MTLIRDDHMNAGFRHGKLFVGALFLALGAVTIAAEPNASQNSADSSAGDPSNATTHGLLTRFWNPVPAKAVFQSQPDIQQELAAEEPILPSVGTLGFPAANWSNRPISNSLAVASYKAANSMTAESLTLSTGAQGGE